MKCYIYGISSYGKTEILIAKAHIENNEDFSDVSYFFNDEDVIIDINWDYSMYDHPDYNNVETSHDVNMTNNLQEAQQQIIWRLF